jgi:hypothetical protein
MTQYFLAIPFRSATFAWRVLFGLKMSLTRHATVARRGIFLSACRKIICRATSARWLVLLRAAASLLWHPSWVRLFLKASLLSRATVARRDTFLQAAANFLQDPQIPRVSFFGSSRRPAACFLPLCHFFRPLTGFSTASSKHKSKILTKSTHKKDSHNQIYNQDFLFSLLGHLRFPVH